MPKAAAVRALARAKSALNRGAPVIRWKATRAPASSTTAMLMAGPADPTASTTPRITSAAISPVIVCMAFSPLPPGPDESNHRLSLDLKDPRGFSLAG